MPFFPTIPATPRLRRASLALAGALTGALALGASLPAAAQTSMGQTTMGQAATGQAATPVPPGTGSAGAVAPSGPGIALGGTGLTLGITPSVSNDYLFRGISQTRNNWAVQGTFDLAHESGLYVGAFVSNAKFLAVPYNDTRMELDALAGYRFTLAGVNFDLGYVGYFYPGQSKPEGTQLNEFHEIVARANTTFGEAGALGTTKVSAAVAYSPNFFGRSGTAWYVEGGLDVTLPFEVTGFGRLGYQWIQSNTRFGAPDYLWYGVGIQREIFAGVTAAVGWYGTDISKSQCAPLADRADRGQRICEGRVLFTLSRAF